MVHAAGIVDDVFGVNFYSGASNSQVQDQNGHGTYVAGIIGATANNNLGVAGINQVPVQLEPARS